MIKSITYSDWWSILGCFLLVTEIFGTSGYFLCSGISAILVGLTEWFFPLSWKLQGISFSFLTLLSMFFLYRWLCYRATLPQSNINVLNQRSIQLIGLKLILPSSLKKGHGHVRIADSIWPVQANEDLSAGTPVIVTGVVGITLLIQLQE